MSKPKPNLPPPPQTYVRHTRSPDWGVGVLVEQAPGMRTYLFTDGTRRRLTETACREMIVAAEPPAATEQIRLRRGLVAGGVATPKAVHLELEAMIRERPDDPGPFLVYADWLQTQADPRGELVTLQRARQAAPDDRTLRRRETDLFAKHSTYFVPASFATMLDLPRRKTDPPGTRCELSWRLGFFDHVRIARRNDMQPTLAQLLPDVLRHPSAQFLRGVTIGPLGEGERADYKPVVTMLTATPPPMLRELVVGDTGDDQPEVSSIGNLSPILLALPELSRLSVRAGSLRFDSKIKHFSLTALAITTAALTARSVKVLMNATLPALESLELACPGLVLQIGELEALLDRLPRLRHLTLLHTVRTSNIVHALLGSQALAGLETLSLRGGDLGDEIVALFGVGGARIGHLTRLDLSSNRLTPAGAARLASISPAATPAASRAGARIALTPTAVLARTRDPKHAAAAKKAAGPANWLELGRDGDRLWGEYEGSDHYYVSAWIGSKRTGCSCPSGKMPCKHALGLLLLAAQQHPIPERKIPDAVARHTNSKASWRDDEYGS